VSAVFAITVDLAIAFAILIGMLVWYRIAPAFSWLLVPALLLLLVLATLGVGLWLSALNVKYRDVAHAVPFLMQFGLLLTPVAYSISVIPEQWQFVYAVNPMVGVIEGLRWALLGTPGPPLAIVLISAAATMVIFCGGLLFFGRMENDFADIV
jgi:lipopolysaccharide transport system permease protein